MGPVDEVLHSAIVKRTCNFYLVFDIRFLISSRFVLAFSPETVWKVFQSSSSFSHGNSLQWAQFSRSLSRQHLLTLQTLQKEWSLPPAVQPSQSISSNLRRSFSVDQALTTFFLSPSSSFWVASKAIQSLHIRPHIAVILLIFFSSLSWLWVYNFLEAYTQT